MVEDIQMIDSELKKTPTMNKGKIQIVIGGALAALGVIMYVISEKTYIVTKYHNIGNLSIPYEVAEKTYADLLIPGIIVFFAGLIVLIIGILTFIKSSN